jgi:hypothetical protein
MPTLLVNVQPRVERRISASLTGRMMLGLIDNPNHNCALVPSGT